MRYEKLDWQLSTCTCEALLKLVEGKHQHPWGFDVNAVVNAELYMIANELRARLQHMDPDPHAPKNDNTDLTT